MFEEIIYQIHPSTIFFVLVFLISFTLIHLSLNKVLNKNPGTAGVLAFLVALGITYGLWNYGFDVEQFIYDLGITSDILYFLIPILIILIGTYIAIKFGLSVIFLSLGGLIMISSFWAYKAITVFIIGLILFSTGITIAMTRKKKEK